MLFVSENIILVNSLNFTGSGPGSSEEEVPSSLLSLRTLLARELHDLLRTVPRCQMPFSRYILLLDYFCYNFHLELKLTFFYFLLD